MFRKPIVVGIFLLFISVTVSIVATGEDNEQTYLISWNSYVDMDIDTSPLNKPFDIGVSQNLPITISYWTDIPDFFRKIPSLITYNFLFGQSVGQVQELHIEVLNTPDWANIYFSPSVVMSDIPFESEEKKLIQVDMIISLNPEAPPEKYKIDLEVSCDQFKRLNGFSYQESTDFTPAYFPCLQINSPLNINITQEETKNITIQVINCGNEKSKITPTVIENTHNLSFQLSPGQLTIEKNNTGIFELQVTPSSKNIGNTTINMNFKTERHPFKNYSSELNKPYDIALQIIPKEGKNEDGFPLTTLVIILLIIVFIFLFMSLMSHCKKT